MISFFGFVLVIFSLIFLTKKYFKLFEDKIKWDQSYLNIAGIFFAGLLMIGIFYAEPGHSYKVYYPINYPIVGNSKIVTSPGFTFDWWGQRREFQNEIVFKYVITDSTRTMPDDMPDNIYAIPAVDHEWEFADAVKAHIGVSVVFSLNPENEINFSEMVDDAKSEKQLVYGRILPDVNTAIKNTAKLMYAQEYISGEAANFDRYLKDQLENGSYQLETYFDEEEEETIGDTLRVSKISKNGGNKKSNRRWRIKEDPKTKLPLRDGEKTSLSLYHITVRQAVSDNIDWEDKFDDRLDKQKALVAETQLEKQGAEKALYNQKKLFAEGEAAKTGEKAKLEKEQIQQTIAAETAAKVALFKVQEETNLYSASIKTSQRIHVEAEAEAFKNKQLVSAGLTPQEKMKFLNERYIGVAKELSQTKYPNFVSIGGSGGSNSDGLLSTLLSAKLTEQFFPTKSEEK